ncbi:hypothetical protein T440DRAFT_193100 [Plenodomus tracheiphilus IPT5]|uniref:Secreted protein n=1 Tax=Plenodomus tracheiphilus IPT5 TaxID=1408161 RepID=A0A6A7AZI8_9PLEO|nr:hypothetical protein T440DRAFT_193100 [Plenodomus tracheiphilus IPT5]
MNRGAACVTTRALRILASACLFHGCTSKPMAQHCSTMKRTMDVRTNILLICAVLTVAECTRRPSLTGFFAPVACQMSSSELRSLSAIAGAVAPKASNVHVNSQHNMRLVFSGCQWHGDQQVTEHSTGP